MLTILGFALADSLAHNHSVYFHASSSTHSLSLLAFFFLVDGHLRMKFEADFHFFELIISSIFLADLLMKMLDFYLDFVYL